MISKFKEVLLNEELESDRLRDALKTLNEQVHHQVCSKCATYNYLMPSLLSYVGNVRHDDRPGDPRNCS